MDSLGLYISVPFCRAKCTFCNFASGVYAASAMPGYTEAVVRQAHAARSWAAAQGLVLPLRADTVYLGGGTPSLLPPALLLELFGALRSEFQMDADAEITLEAAPLQLEPATLEAALAAGVNRISFGVQSFVDGEARATARMHTGEEALREFERMRRAGVPHVSADLIAGLPGQTAASWRRSLDMLAQGELDHASVYMFELDGKSRLGAEALAGGLRYGASLLPNDDVVADWYGLACELLDANGLAQYEISNFARAGGESRHNERYWLRRPYLGLGSDAHSMLRAADGSAARFATGEHLDGFLKQPGWSGVEQLSAGQELEESWFLGLRRNAGVSPAALAEQFGEAAVAHYLPAASELVESGLMRRQGEDRLALTARGRLLSNDVFAALLAAGESESSHSALSTAAFVR